MKILLLTTLIVFFSCTKKIEKKPEVIRPVRSVVVYNLSAEQERSFSGVVSTSKEAKLSFKVGGTLIKLHVTVGDKIKKGQLIAELDDKDLKLKQIELEANLKKTRSEHRNAASEYERIAALYANNNSSMSELDMARGKSETAKTKVEIAKSQYKQSTRQVRYTKLTAHIDGNISKVDVEVNENISPNTPIIYLQSQGKLEVEVDMPENFIADVKKNDSVRVEIDAIADSSFNAKVNKVGVSALYSTIFPVTILLNKENKKLRSGMTATAIFKFSKSNKRSKNIVVPSFAVAKDQSGNFVYTLIAEKDVFKVVKTNVVVGEIQNNGIEIIEGLTDGDRVLTAGISQAYEGKKVKLIND